MPLCSSSIAKSESIVGIKSDRFVVIDNGSIMIAFVRIRNAPVAKGESALGIKSDRFAVISDGSIVVAFISHKQCPGS